MAVSTALHHLPRPLVLPRHQVAIPTTAHQRVLDRDAIAFDDPSAGDESALNRLAADPETTAASSETRTALETGRGRVETALASLDPALTAVVRKAADRMLGVLSDLESKAIRSAKRRDEDRRRHFLRARAALLPGGIPPSNAAGDSRCSRTATARVSRPGSSRVWAARARTVVPVLCSSGSNRQHPRSAARRDTLFLSDSHPDHNSPNHRSYLSMYAPIAVALIALIGRGATQECREWNTVAFFQAADARLVENCLATGSNVHARTDGRTPLLLAAAFSEDPAVVRVLERAGGAINAREEWSGETAVHLAAGFNGNPVVFGELIAMGADATGRDNRGETALHHAARSNGAPVVTAVLRALVGTGITVGDRSGVGRTALQIAVLENDDRAVVTALLEAGANAMVRDERGRTPLHYAAATLGRQSVLDVLLSADSDVNARDENGRTPLLMAASSQNSSAIRALVVAGADIDARDENGMSVLHLAAETAERSSMVEAILDLGVDVSAATHRGLTALHHAARVNDTPAVLEALLAAGADAGARDEDGLTPFHYAASNEAIRGTDVYWRLNDARFR